MHEGAAVVTNRWKLNLLVVCTSRVEWVGRVCSLGFLHAFSQPAAARSQYECEKLINHNDNTYNSSTIRSRVVAQRTRLVAGQCFVDIYASQYISAALVFREPQTG
jgi:hypothetical protein